ncbi:L-threonylcarbamoyladenylate synthase type 1 TsaC [Erwinia sp. OLTSP20]|uniref:L-threonylcarbamoyladenylate synthase type 1 TsaC n=1 Tax=unclassified Erwinia TaxID=2622719 RepID=UPI000C17742F|nr:MULTISPECIES: L-threonylcarbamoyladenylate synthase type 1 TsaC [unclassified Erwinia]PIJ49134.1 L-threonylcarbamoyladenylate synthase type 1 TsaC [Erwinia sp. OAMSP11]PIJ67714.1 L-threonylcarbamoyladenylate synthase type 1 TsaC [Erwinia sp. OLSSP12]PIJ79055.1 L-threonylcarbamoyladenylate synthase type 1 TsaC [Erwinia sp. OLCASP19]PIJ80170.1 L-threonylcarbamoyladenylate synthase type 1 TsaC [Erwinia sp. OLMTSP26]PIJ83200.1 L-threonylcarbamoyladenylate synthase type 1 TsaC [Erwinia sp. OLMDS
MNLKNNDNFIRCLDVLYNEGVIAYPTEAVFGLGCNPDSELAVMKLLALKQRLPEKGLILIADTFAQLERYVAVQALSAVQKERMFASWPGPVTWILPACADTPRWLTGRFDSLAVRVTAHPLVKTLCREFGKPLVSTSANLSGQAPCRSVQEVQAQFGADFPVLAGQTGGRANPSEIRDVLTGKQIRQG